MGQQPAPSGSTTHTGVALTTAFALRTLRRALARNTAAHLQPLLVAGPQYSAMTRGVLGLSAENQASVRSKFRITDPELLLSSSISLGDLLEEAMGGRSQGRISKKEIYLPSCFDWLLKDD